MINPWLETLGVLQVALLGVLLGRASHYWRKSRWVLGYLLPLLLIAMLVLGRYNRALQFAVPFSWILMGRIRFIVLSFAVTMGLTAPLSRLPHKGEKILVCILMGLVVARFSVLPFLMPALIRSHLSSLRTRLDPNGICIQTTDYTCGPAAAVTALGELGLVASEGEIAVLSYSCPAVGTLPSCLSRALQNRFAADGLECRYRSFQSISELSTAGVTLAVVKDGFLLDHCVAVLEVSDQTITVADPVKGRRSMSHRQFEDIWRFSGIVLNRDRS